jgi:hypothetical protein
MMKIDIPHPDEINQIGTQITIHKWDTWNMDHTLALIILPMLKQLKKEKHGSPYVDHDDVPEELRPKETDEYGTDDTHFARWDYVMNEMIFAFENKVDDSWEDRYFTDYEEVTFEFEWKGVGPAQLRLFPDENGDMEDYELYEWVRGERPSKFDQEGLKKYQERISNGFRLFGKYYESLWD